ncbi:Penicillin-binding protein 3 [Bibersteinia trehalosi USDA-ARS-USMARC-188]|uniref:Peptidoglycan D,D-transpeptidase FtsI n=1 Tax=Bibersteinia trehalosi USDA-ARS-USMARC-188 TaxID=1263829 RepID=A0A4V7IBH9_BIBTR|nr:penicillin-binding transpeptidase domain-containing protein [Bibersteinia trehalosi]AHG82374.1 Penicillin-binding protein 3 [Bibersteinia trehalosi USDA-ARS-USMARC-188]
MKKSIKPKKAALAENSAEHQANGKAKASFLPIRFGIIYLLLGLMAVGLLAQSFYLQVVDSERLIEEANKRSIRTEQLPFTRGKILDRNGQILSVSVPMHSITMDPKEYFDDKLRKDRVRWRQLSREIGISASKMEAAVNNFIKQRTAKDAPKKYDPRALFNIKGEDYWTLLARSSGADYNLLIEKVRNNPQSEFLRLEYDVIRRETEKLQALAKQSGKKYNELLELLYKRSNDRFTYIARHLEEEIADYVRKLRIVGIVIKVEPRSVYPLGEITAQLVGYTNKEGIGRDSRVGIPLQDQDNGAGIEYSFNDMLMGKDGKKVVRRDRNRNMVGLLQEQKAFDPNDLELSIDAELQSMAYEEIKRAVAENKAESGTAVLVDVQTGEILAMANAPSFNPNDPNRRGFATAAARNRAITDTFEPGSTVKPLVVLTALQNKVTYMDEVIGTRPFTVNGHTIKDVAPRESLTLTGILQKSSNIGVSRLALRLPSIALLIDTYNRVGFGKSTGLGLGGETQGSNGDRKRWSDIERATLSYGYGLNVTPVQLARAYATLGSFGIYRPLSITKVDPPVIGERVLPEKITRDVVKMMESVAQKGEGGQHAAVSGYRVAVKTGTARKLEKGQYVEKYLAYTAGIAPASDPRFALVVLINEPKAGAYYGGAISAPLFSKIMGYSLKARNIKPDNLN